MPHSIDRTHPWSKYICSGWVFGAVACLRGGRVGGVIELPINGSSVWEAMNYYEFPSSSDVFVLVDVLKLFSRLLVVLVVVRTRLALGGDLLGRH